MPNPMQPPAGMPPQQPQPPDVISQLMAEYERLEAKSTPKPMFTPEEVAQRTADNQAQAEVGLLGSMSGDSRIQGAGGGMLKRALAARQEQATQRGVMNPLTGEERPSEQYQQEQNEGRRDRILNRALTYQTTMEGARTRADTAKSIAEIKAQAAGNKPQSYNMVRILDEKTGEYSWQDPRTMEVKGPVKTGSGEPAVKMDKMPAADEKLMSELTSSRAATNSALAAIEKAPTAFGMKKGAANLPGGGIGTVFRAVRDKRMKPEELEARAMVYNNVSRIIKERAGTAQSAGELARLNGFLPSDLDDYPAIKAKLTGFNKYLAEQDSALRTKYAGPRPVAHMGPTPGAAPAAEGKKVMKFNPATGELE